MEGGLSREAVQMIADLLNEQSLLYLALTEMIYIESDVSDDTTYDQIIVYEFYQLVYNQSIFSSFCLCLDFSNWS